MTKDQNTIGLSAGAAEHLKRVFESGWFATELDACRVAVAVALSRNLATPDDELTGLTTKYNVGTFDRDGSVMAVLRSVGYPEGEGPYAYAERLMHAGLRAIAEDLESEGMLLSDILAGGEASPDSAAEGGDARDPENRNS